MRRKYIHKLTVLLTPRIFVTQYGINKLPSTIYSLHEEVEEKYYFFDLGLSFIINGLWYIRILCSFYRDTSQPFF